MKIFALSLAFVLLLVAGPLSAAESTLGGPLSEKEIQSCARAQQKAMDWKTCLKNNSDCRGVLQKYYIGKNFKQDHSFIDELEKSKTNLKEIASHIVSNIVDEPLIGLSVVSIWALAWSIDLSLLPCAISNPVCRYGIVANNMVYGAAMLALGNKGQEIARYCKGLDYNSPPAKLYRCDHALARFSQQNNVVLTDEMFNRFLEEARSTENATAYRFLCAGIEANTKPFDRGIAEISCSKDSQNIRVAGLNFKVINNDTIEYKSSAAAGAVYTLRIKKGAKQPVYYSKKDLGMAIAPPPQPSQLIGVEEEIKTFWPYIENKLKSCGKETAENSSEITASNNSAVR